MEYLMEEFKNKHLDENKDIKISFVKGPIEMNAANEFMIIYSISTDGCPAIFKIKLYKKPDVKRQMIIRDFKKQLEFSTFLDDEQILLKTA